MRVTPPERERTLRDHFVRAMRESARWRPFSFYLLFAVIGGALIAAPIFYVDEEPKRFAFFLALSFVLFAAIIFRAIVDFFDIARKGYRERQTLYRETLGDKEFTAQLGKGVAAARDE